MEKKNSVGTFLKTAGIITGLSFASYKAFSEYLFNKVFKAYEKPDESFYETFNSWLSKSNVDEVLINSFDGYKLSGYRIFNNDTNNYIIMVPGAKHDKSSLFDVAYKFDKLGYNLLVIDNRGCGDSEGEFITYGQKESLDIIKWINYLTNKIPNCNIVLYGVSLGAASICLALGTKLPDNVRCAISDSSYSSFKEEYEYIVKRYFKIPIPQAVSKILETKMHEKLGIKFDDISPKIALRTNEIPICFVHCKDDKIVPYKMSKILYNSNKGSKKFYPHETGGHAKAYTNENYATVLNSFIIDNIH